MTTYRACPSCQARVVWATTRNGKRQILDYTPDPAGNVAAWQDHLGGWHARTITIHSEPVLAPEHLMMPHWASHPQCRPPSPQAKQAAADVVTFLDAWRRGKAAHNAVQRRPRARQRTITGYRVRP